MLGALRMVARASGYNCGDCPAFCCSVYEKVAVTRRDLRRLAAHFGLDEAEAERRLTKRVGGDRVLRRKSDPVLGTACKFLDSSTRRCTIYEGRPAACRAYPGQRRCAYYELYAFEREAQGDPHLVPLVQITFPGPRNVT